VAYVGCMHSYNQITLSSGAINGSQRVIDDHVMEISLTDNWMHP